MGVVPLMLTNPEHSQPRGVFGRSRQAIKASLHNEKRLVEPKVILHGSFCVFLPNTQSKETLVR